jgi:hypothetical protein
LGTGGLRLIFYPLVSIGSFFVGHWVASALGLALFNIGELRVIEGTVVSWLALVTLRVCGGARNPIARCGKLCYNLERKEKAPCLSCVT